MSMPAALPGTEFAEGVPPEADGGEFSDGLWSDRSQVGSGRTIFRQRTVESLGLN